MFIKKLQLFESYPDESVIRTVSFKAGVNFIVDASKGENERGNGVGKTTVLKVIDICLGAKDRKYLYIDDEISSVNLKLQSYINDNKVYATLELVDNLKKPTITHMIRVDLFEHGNRFIDDKRYALVDFYKELNLILFDNTHDKPSFRELVSMFSRIDQKSDNDRFLKFLSPYTTDIKYESVYSYLFCLNDQAIGSMQLKLKERIKEIENDLSRLLKLNNIKSINAIEQKLISVNSSIEPIKRKISVLVDPVKFQKNEQSIAEVKAKYSELAYKISQISFKLDFTKRAFYKATNEAKDGVDMALLNQLYQDTKDNFEGLNKSFDELVNFNKQLIQNKVSYFGVEVENLTKQLHALNNDKDKLFEKYKDIVLLIKSDNLDKYVALQTHLEEANREKGRLLKIIELNDSLKEALDRNQDKLGKLDTDKVDPKESMTSFNKYFAQYSNLVVQQGFLLYLTEEPFPVGITNANEGFSTGTKKSVISAFDLAYQSFAKEKGLSRPHFIIHDVIETMDKVSLNNIITISKQIGCQYIVAVLSDKLKESDKVEDADIALTLSDKERLFRM